MGIVLFIIFSFIVLGIVVWYVRNKEFHDNVDFTITKAIDEIKSKTSKPK